ncbi:MAG: alpha-hydroxy-acid oxidizing protein [Bacteroidaceae bacterium]|nr:alpha-hydroxy-acid oxidizing protein [Bacteroidaceae bacterium]
MQLTSNSDKITRDYFDSLLVETRYVDSGIPSTQMTLFGETFRTPIMTAALSHLHNTAVDGMTLYARAAAQSGAVHWVGMGSDEELETIVATGARTIKIIKPHADNREVLRKIEHAVQVGCMAVGMDIDHAFDSKGGYDNVFGLPMKAKSAAELTEFVQAAGIPFIAKGVLSPHDAEKCLKAGCAGIVVSHHHGMISYAVPPLMVLQDILSATGRSIPVFIDCGIESGMDAYKCLALGAKAVSVGRHLMPLLRNGAEAVADRMDEMTAELAGVMARTGVHSLEAMDSTVIHRRTF